MTTKPRTRHSLAVLSIASLALLAFRQGALASSPQLEWNDEFNQAEGTGPDPSKWTYDIGVGNPAGWGNSELESYTDSRSNSAVVADPKATDGKALAIIAQYSNGAYTSARIKTEGIYSFTYGRLEARVKLPTGQGLWPAFWALGSNITTAGWPQCGEMDVMEWGLMSAPDTQVNQTTHWSSNGTAASFGGSDNLPSNYNDDYHVYAVDWYPTYLIYSVDGNVVSTAEIAISSIPAFGDPFFILLNMAVGGTFPGSPNSSTVFPQSYLVDYVRVYSLPTTPLTSLVWAPSSPQNITVTLPAASQVSVSWQPPFSTFGATISGYVLERAGDSAFTQGRTSWNLPASPTTYVDTSITTGSTYYYRISAVSVNGTSDPSVAVEAAASAPAAVTQPQSQTVATGSSVVFGFVATGSPTYQWSLNGTAIPSATSSMLIVNGATAANAGNYTCVATNSSGSATSSAATLGVVSSSDPGRLINLSCRAGVGTGANILIAGFAVGPSNATGQESLLVRASGPALAAFSVPGTLPDPKLDLYAGAGALITSNSGWAGASSIANAAAAVNAFAWSTSPVGKDAALLASEQAGPYTAQVSGATGDTGVSLAEVYDATPAGTYTPASPRLVNLSARVPVGTGGNILIAGFVIGGSTSKTVLVRASGPALSIFGVGGVLSDPKLQLYTGAGALIASNSGWGGDPQIATTAASVGAFSWGTSATPDSALLVTLPPGPYTAQVSGASGDTGVSLVEVYDVP